LRGDILRFDDDDDDDVYGCSQLLCSNYGTAHKQVDSARDNNFYGATLCVSTVFVVAQRLSVCPSVTFVHSIQRAEDIVKLLCRLGSLIILVF